MTDETEPSPEFFSSSETVPSTNPTGTPAAPVFAPATPSARVDAHGASPLAASPPPLSRSNATSNPVRPPGPGLPESLLWMIGLFIIQLAGSIVGGVFVVVLLIVQSGNDLTLTGVEQKLSEKMMLVVSIGQAVFLGSAMLASWLRLRPGMNRRLPLTPVSFLHIVALAAVVVPASLLCDVAYRLAELGWKPIVEQFPALGLLDEANTVEQMKTLVHQAPWFVVVFAISFVPAVAEELVFRGVVGRGLVARWGLVVGVILASLLFASAHLHPVHVAGVIPVGVVLHLAYLSTRSFWAPMFIHFSNNLLATMTALAMDPANTESMTAAEQPPSIALVLTALPLTIALVCLLWQTRVEFVLPDGTLWNPGYPTADAPEPEWHAVRTRRKASPRWYAFAAISLLAFLGALVAEGIREAA